MKKQVVLEENACDVCGDTETTYCHCLGCGKDFCHDHRHLGVSYPDGVFFRSGCEGFYCRECDQNPPPKQIELHGAYKEIAKLRRENEEWYEDFLCRSRQAEQAIKELYQKAKGDEL